MPITSHQITVIRGEASLLVDVEFEYYIMLDDERRPGGPATVPVLEVVRKTRIREADCEEPGFRVGDPIELSDQEVQHLITDFAFGKSQVF